MDDLWIALCLVLVIEGLLPALAPQVYRRTVAQMALMDTRSLRTAGLVSMATGAVLLFFLKN